jgi:tetratricopeptide (TPR) repeat protein
LGKKREAATAYLQVLRLSPEHQEARLAIIALGYAVPGYAPSAQDIVKANQQSSKRKDEAARAVNQANLRARMHQAQALADADETTKSAEELQADREEFLKEAGKKKLPTPDEVRNALFAADNEVKPSSASKPVYANDQDIIIGSYPYHYQKAEQMRRRQQYDKAAEEYDRAIQADPKQIQARLDLGDMMMRLERYSRARISYERAMETFPDSAQPLLKMGNYHHDMKQADKSREFYRKALDKDPQYVEAYNNLAVLDMEEKNYKEAAKLLDEVIKLDPNYQNAYLNRGIIASDIEHDRDAALRHYKKYVELDGPRKPQVINWIKELENPEH